MRERESPCSKNFLTPNVVVLVEVVVVGDVVVAMDDGIDGEVDASMYVVACVLLLQDVATAKVPTMQ